MEEDEQDAVTIEEFAATCIQNIAGGRHARAYVAQRRTRGAEGCEAERSFRSCGSEARLGSRSQRVNSARQSGHDFVVSSAAQLS